jgi:hypothetical protein
MKKTLNLFLVLGVLLVVGLACEATTANLSDVTFAKDKDGGNTFTSANQGDEVYVLSGLNNAGGKYIVRWTVKNSSGEEIKILENNEIPVDGSRKLWLTLTLNPQVFSAGKYNFSITLLNEEGEKEIDNKTGTLTVKGESGGTDEVPEDTDSDSGDDGAEE